MTCTAIDSMAPIAAVRNSLRSVAAPSSDESSVTARMAANVNPTQITDSQRLP